VNKYLIRFNKTAGQDGRGSPQHVWRVFENGREILARHVRINVPSWSEQSGPDWNIACLGVMVLNTEFDIVEINHAGQHSDGSSPAPD
jgi:hypothetical protein